MRAIKFRAWNAKTREMLEVREAVFINGELADYHAVGDHAISGWRGNDVIMQYTGLKDKNGVEICEGDIVRVGKKMIGHNEEGDYSNKVMRWSSWRGCWTFDPEQRDEDQSVVWEASIYDDTEVIGNIYENPELLKEDNHGE